MHVPFIFFQGFLTFLYKDCNVMTFLWIVSVYILESKASQNSKARKNRLEQSPIRFIVAVCEEISIWTVLLCNV